METKIQPIRELTMERIISAPRELVYETWTEAKHIMKWWSPKGFTNPISKADAIAGGAFYNEMRWSDGTIYPMNGYFIELVRPEKIVMTTMAFETSPGIFELENLVTVTLEEIDAKTKLTVNVKVTKAGEGVVQALAGMNQGWNESLDKLVDLANSLSQSAH